MIKKQKQPRVIKLLVSHAQKGLFLPAVICFVICEVVINVISSTLSYQFSNSLTSKETTIVGILFVLAGLVAGSGAALVSTSLPKLVSSAVILCILATITSLFFVLSAFQNPDLLPFLVIVLGMCVCPLQPLSLDILANITKPMPEDISATIVQILGAVLSALVLPLFIALEIEMPGMPIVGNEEFGSVSNDTTPSDGAAGVLTDKAASKAAKAALKLSKSAQKHNIPKRQMSPMFYSDVLLFVLILSSCCLMIYYVWFYFYSKNGMTRETHQKPKETDSKLPQQEIAQSVNPELKLKQYDILATSEEKVSLLNPPIMTPTITSTTQTTTTPTLQTVKFDPAQFSALLSKKLIEVCPYCGHPKEFPVYIDLQKQKKHRHEEQLHKKKHHSGPDLSNMHFSRRKGVKEGKNWYKTMEKNQNKTSSSRLNPPAGSNMSVQELPDHNSRYAPNPDSIIQRLQQQQAYLKWVKKIEKDVEQRFYYRRRRRRLFCQCVYGDIPLDERYTLFSFKSTTVKKNEKEIIGDGRSIESIGPKSNAHNKSTKKNNFYGAFDQNSNNDSDEDGGDDDNNDDDDQDGIDVENNWFKSNRNKNNQNGESLFDKRKGKKSVFNVPRREKKLNNNVENKTTKLIKTNSSSSHHEKNLVKKLDRQNVSQYNQQQQQQQQHQQQQINTNLADQPQRGTRRSNRSFSFAAEQTQIAREENNHGKKIQKTSNENKIDPNLLSHTLPIPNLDDLYGDQHQPTSYQQSQQSQQLPPSQYFHGAMGQGRLLGAEDEQSLSSLDPL
jgi:hypothetical protein